MITTYRAELFQALHTATTSLGWEVIPTPHDELKVFVNASDQLFPEKVYTMQMEFITIVDENISKDKLAKLQQELDYQLDLKKQAEKRRDLRAQVREKLTDEEWKALGL